MNAKSRTTRAGLLGLGFALSALAGCFDGRYLLWQECSVNADCGRDQNCVEGLCLECAGDVCSPYVCPVNEIDGVCPCPGRATYDCQELAATRTNKVDLLFVIDNSGEAGQARLIPQVQALLETLDDNQVEYRIGYTTTDMGNPACESEEATPAAGSLVVPTCLELKETSVDGSEESVARPWIEVAAGANNLASGTPADAVECLLTSTSEGCGFEAPLESLYQAIDKSTIEGEPNFGFLREDAHLLIVLLTDQADCSYQAGAEAVFTDNTVFWGDNTEPRPAICWNAGVECIGDAPPYFTCIPVDRDTSGATTLTQTDAVLYPVEDRYVDQLTRLEQAKLERNPLLEVIVTTIAGVPEGYTDGDLVYGAGSNPEFELFHGIAPGCESTVSFGETELDILGVPPVRLLAFADAMRGPGEMNMFSVCQDNFGGAFDTIDQVIETSVPALCMPVCVAEPVDCTLASFDEGQSIDIPQCTDGRSLGEGQELCFYALSGDEVAPTCSDQGGNVQFGFDHISTVDVPDTVYASCQPSTGC